MNLETLTSSERQRRMNIRGCYLLASVEDMEKEMKYRRGLQDNLAVAVLQEMIDTCNTQKVTNFGQTH